MTTTTTITEATTDTTFFLSAEEGKMIAAALDDAKKFLPSSPTGNSIENVHVVAEDGRVNIEATDRYAAIRASIPVEAAKGTRGWLVRRDGLQVLKDMSAKHTSQVPFDGMLGLVDAWPDGSSWPNVGKFVDFDTPLDESFTREAVFNPELFARFAVKCVGAGISSKVRKDAKAPRMTVRMNSAKSAAQVKIWHSASPVVVTGAIMPVYVKS